MLEFIWLIFVDYLIEAPGALILWSTKGFKGSYSEVLEQNHNKSAVIGVIFGIALLTAISFIAKL